VQLDKLVNVVSITELAPGRGGRARAAARDDQDRRRRATSLLDRSSLVGGAAIVDVGADR
jgi:hypothetical protein